MNFSLEIVGDFFDDYLMKLNNICFMSDHGVVDFFFPFVFFYCGQKHTARSLPSQPFLRL